MNKKPVCFIAMAFGRKDTDILYEKQILPVLKELGISPIIINRKEKNDDLNIQIIEDLLRCDLLIADLTYARPSVYYEAGFAQCKGEVIYTVREDHINNNIDNLRVHFDLQMKPLVVWKNINDKEFSKRLSRRIINSFLKQWDINKKQNEELQTHTQLFDTLPQKACLSLIRNIAIVELDKIGYLNWDVLWKLPGVNVESPSQEKIKSGKNLKGILSFIIYI